MKSRLTAVIPRSFRRRTVAVCGTIFIRALLNFCGLALLLPVLALILDARNLHANRYMEAFYRWGGFADDRTFTVAVCLGVVAVIVLKNLAVLALYRYERNYIYDLYACLSRRLYVGYHNRGLGFVRNANSAELARNVNVVCLTFVAGVLRPIATIASEAMLFLLLFGALVCYNLPVALLTLAVFLPSVWLYYGLVRNRLNRYGDAENIAHREKARIVAETFRGYSDIEINNAFPLLLGAFDRAMGEIVRTRSHEATIGMLPQMLTETSLCAGMALLVLVNLGGNGQAGMIFGVFAVAALRLMPSVRNVMSAWSSLKYNRYTTGILSDAGLSDADDRIEISDRRLPLQHEISVEHLSFRYADSDRDTISDLSLTIRRGERIGIRGASGAGKTTLFNLLLGLFLPSRGTIRIDGTPLTGENRRAWQNSVGYVSQNVFITDSTFLANVALGVPAGEIDRGRAEQALRAARLMEFIETLPQGMETRIGECGCRLSGGQRQRIGIARALYKQADVLFFDEATSSLDSETEESVNRSIRTLSDNNRELTIIVIAHRDSSLEYCDRIITIQEQKNNIRS